MKKIIFIFLLIILVFGSSVYAAEFDVKLDSVRMNYNNSVGNEWYYGAQVNGENISENESIILNIENDESIKLNASMTEKDKVSDYGSKSKVINSNEISESENVILEVIVRGNRGRYSGNTASGNFLLK